MYYILYSLNVLVMVALPLVVASLVARRGKVDWGLFGMGAATFVGSQIFHIPLNVVLGNVGLIPTDFAVQSNLILASMVLGLSSGVSEEVARYLTYRFWAKDARSWSKGLMLGAGHGGIEALIVGVIAALNIGFLFLIHAGRLEAAIPAELLPEVQAQAAALFDVAWYDTILGAVERILTVCVHLAMSIMVLQVFVRGQIRWLFAAIGWHALLNGVAVYTVTTWGAYVAEGWIALMAVASLGIIYALRNSAIVAEPAGAQEEVVLPEIKPVALTAEQLDKTRYD